jgi:hypothetical protein
MGVVYGILLYLLYFRKFSFSHPILSKGSAMKETPRRRITFTSSLKKEISPDQLRMSVAARREALLRPTPTLAITGFWTDM